MTEEVKTTQYAGKGNVAWHIPLGKKGTVRIAGNGGSMVNEELFRNELFRIGGIKTMRGVDEASIFASSYAVGTVEYRFLYEETFQSVRIRGPRLVGRPSLRAAVDR